MVSVSGIGSWPGADIRGTIRMVRDVHLEASGDGLVALPYLPELPARGPGSDMVGRSADLLIDLPVDLQPQGWRMVDRPGRDATRAGALWRQDLDELAEAYDGYEGPLKLQVTGPWTLAAQLWLPLGDRVLSDEGAVRDLGTSLAEGVAGHVKRVQSLIPGAKLTVQIDEPQLSAVVAGRVATESGYSVLPAPEAGAAAQVLARVLEACIRAGATGTVLHSCAEPPPIRVMRDTGAGALSLDLSTLGSDDWDALAAAIESGTGIFAGIAAAHERGDYRESHQVFVRRWRQIGLTIKDLDRVTVTPACGLSGLSVPAARAATKHSIDMAKALVETVHNG